MITRRKKIYVALSGGVDSSVVAALLKEKCLPAGKQCEFDVVGAHMICWKNDGPTRSVNKAECLAEKDAEDARRVADKLGIPFYTFDLTKEYKEKVFDYMIAEYRAGRTPNPDVMCNREIKFGVFLKKALALGADYIATGHYVKKIKNGESYKLISAKDKNKDQSYFLWTLTQEQLSHALFPIGDYSKDEVRELARKFNLPTSEKKDSQGLCFVGRVDFTAFLRNYIKPKKGKIVTTSGEEIGEHDGIEFYTIGQRHGIGIGGGNPFFVVERDKKTNTLIVADIEDDPELYAKEVIINDIHWISSRTPALPNNYLAQIRYRQPLQKCHLEVSPPSKLGGETSKLKVVFDEPQRAVACGQSLVLYDGDNMLGGGVIVE